MCNCLTAATHRKNMLTTELLQCSSFAKILISPFSQTIEPKLCSPRLPGQLQNNTAAAHSSSTRIRYISGRTRRQGRCFVSYYTSFKFEVLVPVSLPIYLVKDFLFALNTMVGIEIFRHRRGCTLFGIANRVSQLVACANHGVSSQFGIITSLSQGNNSTERTL